MRYRQRLVASVLALAFILSFFGGAPAATAAPAEEGPRLESLLIEPSQVQPGQSFTVRVYSRDQHGVRDGQVLLVGPSGEEIWLHLAWDFRAGLLSGSYTVKAAQQAGTWQVELLQLWDTDGGYSEFEPPQVSGRLTLTNPGRADTTPPVVSGARLSAASVPAGGDFALTFSASDDASGVLEGQVCFTAPSSGGADPYWYYYVDIYRDASGLWRADGIAPLDPGPNRKLVVDNLSVWDAAGNRTDLLASDLGLSAIIGEPLPVANAAVSNDQIDLFFGHPLSFTAWLAQDAARVDEQYVAVSAHMPGAEDAVLDDLNDLTAALAAAEADLFQPTAQAGVRLASPAITGRFLALTAALRARLGLLGVNSSSQPLTYAEIVRWSDLLSPIELGYEPSAVRNETYAKLGAAYADLIARGLGQLTLPPALFSAAHMQRSDWNADLLPDYVLWLTPFAFDSALGYHSPAGEDIVVGLDDSQLRNPLDAIDTVIHEYGHHAHDVLLGQETGSYLTEWQAYAALRGVPLETNPPGHDAYPSEAFAEDIAATYAPPAVVRAGTYDSIYPSQHEVPDLTTRVRAFIDGQVSAGLPQPFRLTAPGSEVFLTALSDLTVRGVAAPYETVTLWLTDELAGFLGDEYYGDSLEVRAGADGRFETAIPLAKPGVYIIQAEAMRSGSLTTETAFVVRADRRPLAVTWRLPQQTPQPQVLVTGTVPPGAAVKVGGIAATVTPEGTFNATLPLKSGTNEVTLTVTTADGRSRTLTTTVTHDPTGPLLPPAPTAAKPLDKVATLAVTIPAATPLSRLLLSGQAEPGATVKVNGVAAPVNVDGGFVALLKLSAGANPVTVETTDAAGNTARATGSVTPVGAPPNLSLRDLNGHWAQGEVLPLIALRVVDGFPDGTFGPGKSVTRAEFAKMLALSAGLSPTTRAYPALATGATGLAAERTPFIDTVGHWADGYIQAAVRAGFIVPSEYAEGRFDPDGRITRREIAVMAVRALGQTAAAQRDVGPAAFSDHDAIGAAWEGYAVAAQTAGIVKGFPDGSFAPDAYATRAEAAAIMNRVLAKLER